MMIWKEALALEDGKNKRYVDAGITTELPFFIMQRSLIPNYFSLSLKRLIAPESGDTVDLAGRKSNIMHACHLARLLGLEKMRDKVEGYDKRQKSTALRFWNGATKEGVLEILAELVGEVKRRMQAQVGELDHLVAGQWASRGWMRSLAEWKRVFARMIFAAVDISKKRKVNRRQHVR